MRKKLERELVRTLLPIDQRPKKRRKPQQPDPQPRPQPDEGPPWTSTERRLYFWERKVCGLRFIHQIRLENRKLRAKHLLFSCLRDLLGGPQAMAWRRYYHDLWRRGVK